MGLEWSEGGYRRLAEQLRKTGCAMRKTWLDGACCGRAMLAKGGDNLPAEKCFTDYPFLEQTEEGRVLWERFSLHKTLLICGGGHVSRPVAQLGRMLGYRVVVLDDRAEFAAQQRFPEAEEVVCADFLQGLRGYDWQAYPDTSVVIVTRGHAADTVCLRAVLQRPLPYVGMIGSKKKNAAVFDLLRREGMEEARLSSVHAPIGLAIGAQTPEEIAVSIAAELIAARKNNTVCVMDEQMLDAIVSCGHGIMATVVSKQGSAPRGVGARMLFTPDAKAVGTVGGGLAEHEIMRMAKKLLPEPRPMLRHFDMSSGEAGKSGLICGGEIEVLFEVVE